MSTGFNSLQVQTVHNMFSVGKDKGFLMFLGHLRLNLKKKFMCEPLFSSFDGSRPDFSSV